MWQHWPCGLPGKGGGDLHPVRRSLSGVSSQWDGRQAAALAATFSSRRPPGWRAAEVKLRVVHSNNYTGARRPARIEALPKRLPRAGESVVLMAVVVAGGAAVRRVAAPAALCLGLPPQHLCAHTPVFHQKRLLPPPPLKHSRLLHAWYASACSGRSVLGSRGRSALHIAQTRALGGLSLPFCTRCHQHTELKEASISEECTCPTCSFFLASSHLASSPEADKPPLCMPLPLAPLLLLLSPPAPPPSRPPPCCRVRCTASQ